MSDGRFEAYEDLRAYPLDVGLREQLFTEQLECVVVWTTADGWPMGVTHWFVWREGRFWVTSSPKRKKVAALKVRPKSCVIVSSLGTSLGPARTVSAKTVATIHDDDRTKEWFFRELAAKTFGADEVRRAYFERMLAGTRRVVIGFEPIRYVTFDARKMWAAAGTDEV